MGDVRWIGGGRARPMGDDGLAMVCLVRQDQGKDVWAVENMYSTLLHL